MTQPLEECIESIIHQEYDNNDFEVLLVDDGSTDKSSSICDYYVKKFNHVKVIHKNNGGLSDARNSGIRASRGEYLLFLDGDDTLVEKTLSVCDELLDNQDILIGNQNRITKSGIEKKDFPNSVFDNGKDLKKILEIFIEEYGIIPWAAYQSIYKTELLKNNNVYFKKGLIGAEDCDFFFRYIKYIDTFSITNHSFVNYLMTRSDSIMNSVKYDNVIGRLETFSNIYNFSDGVLQNFFSKKFCNTILDLPKLPSSEDRQKCLAFIGKNETILDYAKKNSLTYRVINCFWNIFGIVKGSSLINVLLEKSGVKK